MNDYNIVFIICLQPATRYPAPIQRPVNFQPTLNSSLQSSGNVSNRHRPTHNQNSRGTQRQYYGGQGTHIHTAIVCCR